MVRVTVLPLRSPALTYLLGKSWEIFIATLALHRLLRGWVAPIPPDHLVDLAFSEPMFYLIINAELCILKKIRQKEVQRDVASQGALAKNAKRKRQPA